MLTTKRLIEIISQENNINMFFFDSELLQEDLYNIEIGSVRLSHYLLKRTDYVQYTDLSFPSHIQESGLPGMAITVDYTHFISLLKNDDVVFGCCQGIRVTSPHPWIFEINNLADPKEIAEKVRSFSRQDPLKAYLVEPSAIVLNNIHTMVRNTVFGSPEQYLLDASKNDLSLPCVDFLAEVVVNAELFDKFVYKS